MYDLQKATEIYNKNLSEDSNYAKEIVEEWRDSMPENFAEYMFRKEYGCHIVDVNFYNKAISYLKWSNGKGMGAKWSVDEIKKVSGIDFDDKDYYLLDFAYIMNMLWSDYCNVFTDSSYYIKMSVDYLEDVDYMGDPSERAYKNAKKRIRYFKEKEEYD